MLSKTSCTGHLNSVIPFCCIPFKLSSCLKSIFLKSDAFLYLKSFQPKSTIVGLIKEMIAKFEEELPLYSLSSSDAARQSELLSYIAKITEGVDILIYW